MQNKTLSKCFSLIKWVGCGIYSPLDGASLHLGSQVKSEDVGEVEVAEAVLSSLKYLEVLQNWYRDE